MKKFNFFTILAKDDKELIHSSFIQFLLKDEEISELLLKELFPKFTTVLNKNSITLEKVYSHKEKNEKNDKVSKRIRLDIEGSSLDENTILVIENKFKSFPNEEQLKLYDECLLKEHGTKNIIKYLLCFDINIIPKSFNKSNWNLISYNDLLNVIKNIVEKIEIENDKKTFIEHYKYFLTERFQKYEEIKKSCAYLFFDGRNDENKFWIRHVNAITRLKLESYFTDKGIPVSFIVNPGNTSVPLINISPDHWNKLPYPNLCIQVQDDNLKYYYGANEHIELNLLIESAKKDLKNDNKKAFNKLSPNRGRTNFIYQEKLDRSIVNDSFSVDDFAKRIIDFFEKIDIVAKKRFSN